MVNHLFLVLHHLLLKVFLNSLKSLIFSILCSKHILNFKLWVIVKSVPSNVASLQINEWALLQQDEHMPQKEQELQWLGTGWTLAHS